MILLPNGLQLAAFAEALVYYGHVEILYQNGSLCDLIEAVGIDETIRIAESDLVTILYDFGISAILTEESDLLPYSFCTITLAGDASGRRVNGAEDEMIVTTRRRFGTGAIPARKIRRLMESVQVRETPNKNVTTAALSDMLDSDFLSQCVRFALHDMAPEYPFLNLVRADSVQDDSRFLVTSNINLRLANLLSKTKHLTEDDTITYPHLINPIYNVRAEMFFAGDSFCDIWASDLHSSILRHKVKSFFDKIDRGRENIDRFEDIKFQGRSFGVAINSGERTIVDILNFAESKSTRKFKSWLRERPSNGDLISEYEKSVISGSRVVSGLPYKMTKIVLMSALGTAIGHSLSGTGLPGLAGGMVASFATDSLDDILLSKLNLGWRPDHWVSGPAKHFLGPHKNVPARPA